MTIVVIDLIPALLSWEGRDRSSPPELAPDGVEAVSHLFSHYRLVGVADAGVPVQLIRQPLEEHRIVDLFDSVGTSAGFGPTVNARVVRRATTYGRANHPVVFITGRERLATELSRSRTGVVLTDWKDFGGTPEAVAMVLAGRVSP